MVALIKLVLILGIRTLLSLPLLLHPSCRNLDNDNIRTWKHFSASHQTCPISSVGVSASKHQWSCPCPADGEEALHLLSQTAGEQELRGATGGGAGAALRVVRWVEKLWPEPKIRRPARKGHMIPAPTRHGSFIRMLREAMQHVPRDPMSVIHGPAIPDMAAHDISHGQNSLNTAQ